MKIRTGRWAASREGEFVVFLIGMRINKPSKIGLWFPILLQMPLMIRWLDRHPQEGLLHWEFLLKSPRSPTVLQYWRSFEDLERFARSTGAPHLQAWKDFNAKVRDSGDVGIWHETYTIGPGRSEAIFVNMPPRGVGAAGELAPVGSTAATAAKRLGARESDVAPVDAYQRPS